MPPAAAPQSSVAVSAVSRPGHGTRNRWGAVALMAAATFIVVAAEMMPVGLLTPMSASLAEGEGTIGLSLTITGLVAAVTAPFIPIVTGRIDRRATLIALMVLVVAANALTAISDTFLVLAAARVLLGLSMGGVWALAASLAPRLVGARAVGLATTVIFSGIALASVLGVPIGTYVGAVLGWNAVFWGLAIAAALIALAMATTLPAMPSEEEVPFNVLVLAFKNPGVRVGLAITALLVTGHFSAYTYVRPALEVVAGLGAPVIGTLLVIYGALGIVGNFVAGPPAAKVPRVVIVSLSLGLVCVLALFPSLATATVAAAVLMAAWGFFYGGVSVSTQAWIARAAPEHRESVAALWVSVFNASIALGAFAGGRLLDSMGPSPVFWVSAGIGVTAFLMAIIRAPESDARRVS
ncbi:MFS transporter [Pseudoclavibacter sp. VKM Ac-2888]|nr:MFS transporter [Pseudoclavibacter sp. VKM Ac-2888]PPF73485.1 MFS transporter [Pseudoclavibacter sp. Z016]